MFILAKKNISWQNCQFENYNSSPMQPLICSPFQVWHHCGALPMAVPTKQYLCNVKTKVR